MYITTVLPVPFLFTTDDFLLFGSTVQLLLIILSQEEINKLRGILPFAKVNERNAMQFVMRLNSGLGGWLAGSFIIN